MWVDKLHSNHPAADSVDGRTNGGCEVEDLSLQYMWDVAPLEAESPAGFTAD